MQIEFNSNVPESHYQLHDTYYVMDENNKYVNSYFTSSVFPVKFKLTGPKIGDEVTILMLDSCKYIMHFMNQSYKI